ncbi:hypothetical protein [Roseovarius amoyensis]|uniref:hypothetical protein n=1 Tax=Roseovarius amoyensis TaxID=2211448 RepID=UPI000DBE3AEA|nr:hypothetical protein [Roseovarius amoyensis]
MKDYKTFAEEYEKSQAFFQSQIANYENKAFEYGVIVVRNAVLISGGGLLAIPTIVGLASEVPVNMVDAIAAGIAFSFALILSILGAYIVHINWMLHAEAWRKHWGIQAEFLRKWYLEDVPEEDLQIEQKQYFSGSVWMTFILPHVMAILFLLSVAYGFCKLYSALGVSA